MCKNSRRKSDVSILNGPEGGGPEGNVLGNKVYELVMSGSGAEESGEAAGSGRDELEVEVAVEVWRRSGCDTAKDLGRVEMDLRGSRSKRFAALHIDLVC